MSIKKTATAKAKAPAKKPVAKAAPKAAPKAAAAPAPAPVKRSRAAAVAPYSQKAAAGAIGITERALVELAKTGHIEKIQQSQRKRFYGGKSVERLAKKLAR